MHDMMATRKVLTKVVKRASKLETAKAMFLDKIPVETISKYTSLPLETVLELAQEI